MGGNLGAAAVPHVWWAFSRQWMNSFVPASEWSSGSLHPNNSVWMVCTGEAWAPLQKRFPHPGRAGHVLLGLGSHSCIPVQHYTSLLLVSFPGAVESECGCQEESRKAKEPKHVRPSCSHTHTHLKPQGSEWESQAGRQPTRWATTSVWGLKQQERVFGSSVRLATWGFDLSLHQITSRQMIFCRALQTLGWLHWALGLKTDEYIQDDDLVSGVMGGLLLLVQEEVKSQLFFPPLGEVLLFRANRGALGLGLEFGFEPSGLALYGCGCVCACGWGVCMCICVFPHRWLRLFFLFININLSLSLFFFFLFGSICFEATS